MPALSAAYVQHAGIKLPHTIARITHGRHTATKSICKSVFLPKILTRRFMHHSFAPRVNAPPVVRIPLRPLLSRARTAAIRRDPGCGSIDRCRNSLFPAMAKQLHAAFAVCVFAVINGASLAQQTAPGRAEIAAVEIVNNFRRMIVLHEAAGRSRDLTQAGQCLFFRNRELTAQLVVDALAPPGDESAQRIADLLDFIGSATRFVMSTSWRCSGRSTKSARGLPPITRLLLASTIAARRSS